MISDAGGLGWRIEAEGDRHDRDAHFATDRREPGIGHATVQRFNAEGWRVITCSRHPFPSECPWGGGAENHVQIDLASPNDVIEKVEVIRARLGGRLDALVNNAGISPKGEDGARLNTFDTDLRTWGHVFHVNFFASVVLARSLRDELAAAQGAVVNVTSIAGSRVHPFAGAAYATSKAALAALTREMAHDFGPLGVRVNAIAPGEIRTDILSRRHRGAGRNDPDAPPWRAAGGGRYRLFPVHRALGLYLGHRDRDQRRPACVRREAGLWHEAGPRHRAPAGAQGARRRRAIGHAGGMASA